MAQEPNENDNQTNDNAVKPTITIAEKEGGQPAPENAVDKPTITIAEKDGGN